MSCSTDCRKYSSLAISIWASKIRDSSGPARCSTRWPSSRSEPATESTASRRRRISCSTCEGGTARSGTSGKSSRMTTAGAQATPGETPTPRITCGAVMSHLPETVGHQLGQRLDRPVGVRPSGSDDDAAPALCGEHHHTHDALSVHLHPVLAEEDAGGPADSRSWPDRKSTR